jgi:hypothetical protein
MRLGKANVAWDGRAILVTPVTETAEELLIRNCQSCHILLVEDDPINREIALELLSETLPPAAAQVLRKRQKDTPQ